MAQYKDPYIRLFNQVSQTIEDLQKVQQECEELYMGAKTKPPIKIVGKDFDDTNEKIDRP